MRVQGLAPTFMHAEKHSAYLPRPGVDRLAEANRIAQQINQTKATDPVTGAKIDDQRVDALIEHVTALAARSNA